MRKFLISAALIGIAAAATPAAAQFDQRGYGNRYDYGRQGQGIDRQLDNIIQRIDRAYQRRLISGNEARRLRDRADDIGRRYDRYRRNGIDRGEYQDIQRRIGDLRGRLQDERREGRDDRRWDDRRDRW